LPTKFGANTSGFAFVFAPVYVVGFPYTASATLWFSVARNVSFPVNWYEDAVCVYVFEATFVSSGLPFASSAGVPLP